jgi:hypothetical protein
MFLKCPVHKTLHHINVCNKFRLRGGFVTEACPKIQKYIKEKTGYGIYEKNNPRTTCTCIPFSAELHLTSHKYCQLLKGQQHVERNMDRIFTHLVNINRRRQSCIDE